MDVSNDDWTGGCQSWKRSLRGVSVKNIFWQHKDMHVAEDTPFWCQQLDNGYKNYKKKEEILSRIQRGF